LESDEGTCAQKNEPLEEVPLPQALAKFHPAIAFNVKLYLGPFS
jgi:hypothetical protein